MERIVVVAHRTEWSDEFETIAARVGGALAGMSHRVHHIGSTAVAGLVAKDIIDIMVSVRDLDAHLIRPRLEALGWTWRNDITSDHMPPGSDLPAADLAKLYAQQAQPRRINCHIRVPGAFNHRYALLFRDYLRANPDPRSAYGEVKRQLARYFPDDIDAYYDVKDPVIDIVMAGAERWADDVQWTEPSIER